MYATSILTPISNPVDECSPMEATRHPLNQDVDAPPSLLPEIPEDESRSAVPRARRRGSWLSERGGQAALKLAEVQFEPWRGLVDLGHLASCRHRASSFSVARVRSRRGTSGGRMMQPRGSINAANGARLRAMEAAIQLGIMRCMRRSSCGCTFPGS
jgi:hypothetical protein